MNKKERAIVLDYITMEGFDYALCGYSSWEEIKDEEFHKLRQEMKEARRKMAEYLKLKEY